MEQTVLLNTVSMFLMALAVMFLPALAVRLYQLVRDNAKKIKSQLTSEQLFIAQEVVKQAILAAEQAGLVDLAQDKKSYAIEAAEALLKTYGITLDLSSLEAMIEAAVFDEFNCDRKPPVQVDQA